MYESSLTVYSISMNVICHLFAYDSRLDYSMLITVGYINLHACLVSKYVITPRPHDIIHARRGSMATVLRRDGMLTDIRYLLDM